MLRPVWRTFGNGAAAAPASPSLPEWLSHQSRWVEPLEIVTPSAWAVGGNVVVTPPLITKP